MMKQSRLALPNKERISHRLKGNPVKAITEISLRSCTVENKVGCDD